MGGIPDALLGGKFTWLEPVGHQGGAWGIPHTMHVAVQDPERTYQVDQADRGLPLRIQEVEETVHLRGEADGKVDDA